MREDELIVIHSHKMPASPSGTIAMRYSLSESDVAALTHPVLLALFWLHGIG
jgi:hypothetical protein